METFSPSGDADETVSTLVTPDDGGGNVVVNYELLDPSERADLHVHERSTDVFVVLSGEGAALTGSTDIEDATAVPISEGDIVHVPPGEPHAMMNDSEAPLAFVAVQAPPDTDRYGPDGRKPDVGE